MQTRVKSYLYKHDDVQIIAALLRDVSTLHGVVFNSAVCERHVQNVFASAHSRGMAFLTEDLPRLGRAFDKALTGQVLENPSTGTSCESTCTSEGKRLPEFIRELFSSVLSPCGVILPDADATIVRSIRQILYLFYKYELPYTHEQEQLVVSKFERTEDELSTSSIWSNISNYLDDPTNRIRRRLRFPRSAASKEAAVTEESKWRLRCEVAREARFLLQDLFAFFDPTDIVPRHGPGAVATKQRLWTKYQWTNVSSRITDLYPFDAYFCASMGHVCDVYPEFCSLGTEDLPARVILVPKDSRGPRLISSEPVDFQWVQQGLGGAIVELVERHPLTKWNVRFTDQSPNQRGALMGSKYPLRYSTLDLAEASDRVSLDQVRALFPEWLMPYLEGTRSSCTVLPDDSILKLKKFAPMGSRTCFPILALTIWALLSAGAPDVDTRECIYVYGDDVIVPTAYAEDAIEQLESYGLKVNHDKSCTSGFFRESCGMDAFKGLEVTPVRLRTVWSSSQSPDVYESWIAYANQLHRRKYYATYQFLVGRLHQTYGEIPEKSACLRAPSLAFVPLHQQPRKRRWSKRYQKHLYLVRVVRSRSIHRNLPGWSMLLRWFTEGSNAKPDPDRRYLERLAAYPDAWAKLDSVENEVAFRVRSYTRRKSSILEFRWR